MNKISFIGAGNMARAIIIGLVNSGVLAKNIMVANPSEEKRLKLAQEFGVLQTDDNNKASDFADVIVLCVKPHFISEVSQKISQEVDITGKLFISVAAGRTVEQVQQALVQGNNKTLPALVRVMPNTPSQLGLGMSGLFASDEVTIEQKSIAEKLMSAVGKIIWLDTEDQINDIIAVNSKLISALMILQLPFSNSEINSRDLEQVTSGATEVLKLANCSISGGHTMIGKDKDPVIGFSVIGEKKSVNNKTLGKLKVNDILILTEKIGSGIIFAGINNDIIDSYYQIEVLKQMSQGNINFSKRCIIKWSFYW